MRSTCGSGGAPTPTTSTCARWPTSPRGTATPGTSPWPTVTWCSGVTTCTGPYLITPEEIAASERDYVALGHWDVPHDMSAGAVTAAYSGSASRYRVCALVTLSTADGDRRVDVERLDLGES